MRIPPASSSDNSDSGPSHSASSSGSSSGGRRSAKTWREYKDEGRTKYNSSDYSGALSSYRLAVASTNPSPPSYERQVLLSNVVACRLKLGGRAHAEAALEEAKQCVAENERWAKGHVRLASAYSALGRSNDACNSLQRAIQLDPSNQAARTMLTQELRRGTAAAGGTSGGQAEQPTPSAPPHPASFREGATDGRSGNGDPRPRPDDIGGNGGNNPNDVDIDDTSLLQNLRFKLWQLSNWYANQSDDVQTVLKVCLGLVVLYVAFGGRFGLGSSGTTTAGNYGRGNVYDQYHGRTMSTRDWERRQDGYGVGGSYDGRRTSTGQHYGRRHDGYAGDDYYASETRHRRSGSGSTSFHFPNLFDGSLPSMLCLAVILIGCHRFGISPFQAVWVLNMLTGGRRRGGMGRGYRMGGFGGMGGFGRRRY